MSTTLPTERSLASLFADPLLVRIAQVAHEANRAYCLTLGDTSQVAWDDAPAWQREAGVRGALAVLDGSAPTPEAKHEQWCADKRDDGWTYGPVKNPAAKVHDCLLPYAELPAAQKVKDALFRAVALAVAGQAV